MPLAEETCVHYALGTAPLSQGEAQVLTKEIPGWTLKDNAIERDFNFKDFRGAVDFVNEAADLAESQDHHPDIHISYNRVRLELSTHRIGGLSRNDFILAAKIDRLLQVKPER